MAALIDNSTKAAASGAASSLESGSFTVAGDNRVLYVAVCSGAGTAVDPTGCKWGGSGGTAMTQIGTTITLSTFNKISLYRLIAPTAQTSTVYATWGSNQDERWMFVVSVKDTDQTTPNNTVAQANGASTGPTVAATSVSGDLVLDFLAGGEQSTNTVTNDASQTLLQEYEGSTAYCVGGCSHETATGTSTTMSWALGTSCPWGIFALAINGAAAGASIVPHAMANYRMRAA